MKIDFKGSQDKTAYACALGYTGTKPVKVLDGRVISHGNRDWFEFCQKLKKRARCAPQKPQLSH